MSPFEGHLSQEEVEEAWEAGGRVWFGTHIPLYATLATHHTHTHNTVHLYSTICIYVRTLSLHIHTHTHTHTHTHIHTMPTSSTGGVQVDTACVSPTTAAVLTVSEVVLIND